MMSTDFWFPSRSDLVLSPTRNLDVDNFDIMDREGERPTHAVAELLQNSETVQDSAVTSFSIGILGKLVEYSVIRRESEREGIIYAIDRADTALRVTKTAE